MNCRITHIGTAIIHVGKASFPATGPIRFTFNAKESVRAIMTLNPRMVILVHYEGWKHFREPREGAEKQFAAGCACEHRDLGFAQAAVLGGEDAAESIIF